MIILASSNPSPTTEEGLAVPRRGEKAGVWKKEVTGERDHPKRRRRASLIELSMAGEGRGKGGGELEQVGRRGGWMEEYKGERGGGFLLVGRFEGVVEGVCER